jgi:hypothetical protein
MQKFFCQPVYTFSFQALGNMIRDVYPGSGSIPDPGIKKAPDPGSESATKLVVTLHESTTPTTKMTSPVPYPSPVLFTLICTALYNTQGKYELTVYCT